MRQYLDLLDKVMQEGVDKPNRTGIDTRAIFLETMRFNLADGFPIITTKKVNFDAVAAELLWFISGSRDVRELQKMGCHIWDENAEADYWKPHAQFAGDLGRVYGVQWRHWRTADGKEFDQLADVIARIKKTPNDRRLIVTAWNPGELTEMALPPCHMFFQFFVANGKLSLSMYQRSCDMFLGVPFNISSYALLLSMIAQVTDLEPGEFVHVLADTHIYHNHFDQVREQLTRTPKSLPQLWLNPEVHDIDSFTMADIRLDGYQHDPFIKAKMAV